MRLQSVEYLAELPDAGLVGEPFGGADGADGKAAAAVGVVAEFEDVVFALRGDDVLAVGVALRGAT